jgi:hypothetical protein
MAYWRVLSLISIVALIFISWSSVSASETDGAIVSDGLSGGYAWSDQAGWVNFGVTNGNIHVTDSGLSGYAWNTNYGWINLRPDTGGVSIAADGSLSGNAWGASFGWIDFSGVSIGRDGKFSGQATGDVIGTMTFDCDQCYVSTDYVPSAYRSSEESSSDDGDDDGSKRHKKKSGISQASESSSYVERLNPNAGPGEDFRPEQLFDIRLAIDNPVALRSRDIVAQVTFASFGRVATPIDLEFSLFDDSGNEIWTDSDHVVVETENVFTKHLPELGLSAGKYTLKLHTRYNGTVEDDFTAEFSIIPIWMAVAKQAVWIIVPLVALLIILLVAKRIRNKNQKASMRKAEQHNA